MAMTLNKFRVDYFKMKTQGKRMTQHKICLFTPLILQFLSFHIGEKERESEVRTYNVIIYQNKELAIDKV